MKMKGCSMEADTEDYEDEEEIEKVRRSEERRVGKEC